MTVTRISDSDATSITVKGKDLIADLIGELTFTEMTYFLITGRRPDRAQTRVLDACLVTLAEHGFTPGAIVTRLIADSVPGELQVAVAGGLATVGGVFAGTMEGCGRLLQAGVTGSEAAFDYCMRIAQEHHAARTPVPGFGHPFHKPDDPRSPRLFAIAEAEGLAGAHVAMLKELSRAVDEVSGRHVTINATGAMAALLLEIGIGPEISRGVAVVSRSAGLLGHILEEKATHSARDIQRAVKAAVPYASDENGAG